MILSMLILGVQSKAQNLSNKGREFWCGYGHHQYMEYECNGNAPTNTQNLVLYFSTEDQAARVKVFIGGRLWYDSTISANTVVSTRNLPKSGSMDARLFTTDCSFTLNPATHPNCDGEGIFKDTTIVNPIGLPSNFFRPTIRILSDVPIVAYEHIYGSVSSGATMLLPTETWGYKYYTLNSRQGDDNGLSNCYSWFYIIAKHNNTRIRITSAQNTRRSNPTRNFLTGENRPYGIKDRPYEIVLNEGQTYQAMGAPECTAIKPEMTGTLIESIPNENGQCFPIAVFAGSSRTGNIVPNSPQQINSPSLNCNGGGRDNDNQQCFPTQAWGKNYILAPLASRLNGISTQTNSYKIAVMDPATVLQRRISGVWTIVPQSKLINNRYYQMVSNNVEAIKSDKPIMVAQFMTGGSCLNGGSGDPEMIYVSPVEQGTKKIGFYRNSREAIRENYLVLSIPEAGLSSLKIDGVLNNWNHSYSDVNAPGYRIVVKTWNIGPGQGFQSTASSDSSFNAVTYGLGGAESYGYNAGTLINNLGAIGSVYNSEDPTTGIFKHEYACDKTPTQLSVLLSYDSLPTRMIWQLSQVGGGLSPNLNVEVGNGVTPIIPNDTTIVNGATYYKFVLPGLYQFNDTGTFIIPISVKNAQFDNECREGLVYSSISVKARPKVVFTSNPALNYKSCILDTVNFYAPQQALNGSKLLLYKWNFPIGMVNNIDTISLEDTVRRKFTQAGTHDVRLRVVNDNGCIGDTTLRITIAPKPVARFVPTQDTAVCIGSTITIRDNNNSAPNWSEYTGDGTLDSIYWKVGDSGFFKTDRNDFSLLLDSAGIYPIKHTIGLGIDTSACQSDTAAITLRVFDYPTPTFTFPPCVDATGQLTLTDATTTPDGQAINATSHVWNIIPGNLSSNAVNPSFTLTPGNYTISHTVSTVNGCTKQLDSITNIYLYPQLAFDNSNPIGLCENADSVKLQARITNGVTPKPMSQKNPWFTGTGVDSTGWFNPAGIGYGTKTITYHVIGTGDCESTVTYNIEVYAKPFASLQIADASICSNQQASIRNLSTITSPYTIASYNLDYGDGTSPFTGATVPNPLSHSYSTHGDYTIKLNAESNNGCKDDTSLTIRVNAVPLASFDLPGAVCIGDTVYFTNQSTSADGLAMTYQWNYGDLGSPSNTSTTLNGAHVYETIQPYAIKLTVTTVGALCSDDTTIVYDRFSDKPVADFNPLPKEVCQGTAIKFEDLTTDPTSTPLTTWAWNFGNNARSGLSSPIYTYPKPGRYQVSLQVTNQTGCKSDVKKDSVFVYVQPRIDAGPNFFSLQGSNIRFNPIINDTNKVSFLWTPANGLLPNATSIRPTLTVTQDQTYTLTATALGPLACSDADSLFVKMLLPVKVPNSFTPNGDGINDTWVIPNLKDYPTMRIQVMNRYGQNVFRTYGYGKAWDGTLNGKALPAGTYFYIIELNNGLKPITGSVSIIR